MVFPKVLAVIEKLHTCEMTTTKYRDLARVPCVAPAPAPVTPSSLRNPRRMFFHLFYCSLLPSFPPSPSLPPSRVVASSTFRYLPPVAI